MFPFGREMQSSMSVTRLSPHRCISMSDDGGAANDAEKKALYATGRVPPPSSYSHRNVVSHSMTLERTRLHSVVIINFLFII